MKKCKSTKENTLCSGRALIFVKKLLIVFAFVLQ